MDSHTECKIPEILNQEILDDLEGHLKQRKALENGFSNFVEPYINIMVAPQPLSPPVVFSGVCCTSGWMLLTLIWCLWKRCR